MMFILILFFLKKFPIFGKNDKKFSEKGKRDYYEIWL